MYSSGKETFLMIAIAAVRCIAKRLMINSCGTTTSRDIREFGSELFGSDLPGVFEPKILPRPHPPQRR
jgi:hypothetical protein